MKTIKETKNSARYPDYDIEYQRNDNWVGDKEVYVMAHESGIFQIAVRKSENAPGGWSGRVLTNQYCEIAGKRIWAGVRSEKLADKFGKLSWDIPSLAQEVSKTANWMQEKR